MGEEDYIIRATEALKYNPFDRWKQFSKSPKSFKKRLENLLRFFSFHNTSAEKLLLLGFETKGPQFMIEQMASKYLASRETDNAQPSTIAKEAGVISGFFGANGVTIKLKYSVQASLESKRVLKPEEVRKMIKFTPGLEERTVICFVAQSAQRIGILTGLTWDMIRRYPVEGSYDYGIIEVKREIKDRNDNCVGNKGRNHYRFGLHWETMKLLDELKAKRKDDPYIFSMDVRDMERAVEYAAKAAGTQVKFAKRRIKVGKRDAKGKLTKTIQTRESHEIHPHVFRRYWVSRMDEANKRVPSQKLLDYQMGHKIPDQTYWEGMLTPEKIVAAFKRADKQLRVLPEAG